MLLSTGWSLPTSPCRNTSYGRRDSQGDKGLLRASWGLGASQESKCGGAVNGGGVDSGQRKAGKLVLKAGQGGAHTEAGLI